MSGIAGKQSTGSAQDPSAVKKPNPVDIHVGTRVRLRRMMIGMSQEKLGEQMGLTFQQIQKYEKGVNRIGASRLFELSRILSVPVDFFFDEMQARAEAATTPGFAEPSSETLIMDFLNTREGLELNRAFVRVRSAKVRRSVIELVKTLCDEDETPAIDAKAALASSSGGMD